MYKAERNAVMQTRPNTSLNLPWQGGVFLTTYSFLSVRNKARGNFRELEIWVRVGKDEASPRMSISFEHPSLHFPSRLINYAVYFIIGNYLSSPEESH